MNIWKKKLVFFYYILSYICIGNEVWNSKCKLYLLTKKQFKKENCLLTRHYKVSRVKIINLNLEIITKFLQSVLSLNWKQFTKKTLKPNVFLFLYEPPINWKCYYLQQLFIHKYCIKITTCKNSAIMKRQKPIIDKKFSNLN